MKITLNARALTGKTVLLTGAGGGIGLEAAKAFAQMGARLLLVEVDRDKGMRAAAAIRERYQGAVDFFHTDLSDETATEQLCQQILSQYGCPDVIFHNAAVVVTGRIGEVGMGEWTASYAVNLRAPVLMTSFFLAPMRARDGGCVVFVSSSGAAPYLSAYEVFKTAQAEFSSALSMELEDTHVYTYTIAPGLVKTETAMSSIETVAAGMGMTLEAFYRQNQDHILDVVDAGIGFAVSVLKADEYHGQEISSIQALNDFGGRPSAPAEDRAPADAASSRRELLDRIVDTFHAQYVDWQQRNVFERQWVLRDFKKYVGMPADAVEKALHRLKGELNRPLPRDLFEKLLQYWAHQLKLLQGFEKNPDKRDAYSREIRAWMADIQALLAS